MIIRTFSRQGNNGFITVRLINQSYPTLRKVEAGEFTELANSTLAILYQNVFVIDCQYTLFILLEPLK